jgi:hypothetical protein
MFTSDTYSGMTSAYSMHTPCSLCTIHANNTLSNTQQNKGTITVKELQCALQSQNMTNAKVEELFNSADVDNK